jgi:uncharacterized protein
MNTNQPQIRARMGTIDPIKRDGRFVLQGERSWILSGDDAQITAAAVALGRLCERIQDTLLLTFGNSVGRIAIPGLGTVEIVSGKWDETHFEQMLVELTDEASGLPFLENQPTGFPYDRSVLAREDIPYHLFVYLRHILSPIAPRDTQLLPALQAVVQQPYEHFESIRRTVPLAAAQRIDHASLLGIAAGVGGLAQAQGTAAARTPLAGILGGYLPNIINERHATHSYDTPENRFVKSFLQLITGVIERMRRVIPTSKTAPAFRERLLNDCTQMDHALAPFTRHPIWQSIGTMTQLPTGSTVLQGRRGYRDVYRHFVRLRLASHIPIDDTALRDLLEAKNIARLYELWCYFRVVRLVRTVLGAPARAERPKITTFSVTVQATFEVAWAQGVRLQYNPRYLRGTGAGRSYSVQLAPDIALHIDGPTPRAHLFDAKFRLNELGVLRSDAEGTISEDDEDGGDDANSSMPERSKTFKHADIHKMHTYRDALQGTDSVWVLYPGNESCFFSTSGQRLNLAIDTLPDGMTGVGAVELRPEASGAETLQRVLEQMLKDIPPA